MFLVLKRKWLCKVEEATLVWFPSFLSTGPLPLLGGEMGEPQSHIGFG